MTSPDQSISGRRWRELLAREGSPWPVAIEDWEQAARDALGTGPRGYVFGGAGSGSTRDANVQAFTRWRLAPHVLATPADRDLSVTVLGQVFPTPIFLAPVGVLTIVHPRGDLAAAAAARDLGMTYIVSTAGSEPMESVTAATPGLSAWYQLYWINSRELTASFVSRAKASGYSALVVTVDTPMLGWRESDLASAYSPFSGGHGIGQFTSDPIFRSMLDFDPDRDPGRAGQEMMKLFVNPGLGWDDLAWLRNLTDLPILLKGVLRADDARRALDVGIDGLIVSNHGGRQVDGSVSALEALAAVRSAVPAGVPVLLDGGVRRGPDVIKAVALGAGAVLVGRPYVYGLAAGGQAGVHEVLSNLLAETDSVLALSGYRSLRDLDCDALVAQSPGQP
jgi:L-lactate dehydrogenase (cytochrome)